MQKLFHLQESIKEDVSLHTQGRDCNIDFHGISAHVHLLSVRYSCGPNAAVLGKDVGKPLVGVRKDTQGFDNPTIQQCFQLLPPTSNFTSTACPAIPYLHDYRISIPT